VDLVLRVRDNLGILTSKRTSVTITPSVNSLPGLIQAQEYLNKVTEFDNWIYMTNLLMVFGPYLDQLIEEEIGSLNLDKKVKAVETLYRISH